MGTMNAMFEEREVRERAAGKWWVFLFTGIAWSTAGVLQATLARAAAAGLAVHLLPPSFDVDQVADLARLRGLVARDDVSLPRTAGMLAGLAAVLDSLSRPGGNSG